MLRDISSLYVLYFYLISRFLVEVFMLGKTGLKMDLTLFYTLHSHINYIIACMFPDKTRSSEDGTTA